MQHLVKQNALDWEVDSAGTGSWHVGQCPDGRSTRVAKENGVDISQQVCRVFSVSDFDEFDHIIVMDRNNLRDVLAKARNHHDRQKVTTLLGEENVPDPYYDDTQFDPVYKMIEKRSHEIIEEFTSKA